MGISGAIYKNLYLETIDIFYLEKSLSFYSRGYVLDKNYYNGSNVAICNELLCICSTDREESIFYKLSSRKIREEILQNCINLLKENELNNVKDIWLYTTLAGTYLYFDDEEKFEFYRQKFIDFYPNEWQIQAFEKGLAHYEDFINHVK
ncbi:MAG: hypothetical protein PHC62_03005 [Candidatus Izemoplasmatales bacterium]|nr:hypothetical protein [Candidatus Izemoplasmatales bacterium]